MPMSYNPADSPDDRIALAVEHMKSAMPQEMAAAKVEPTGWLGKTFYPKAWATTSPLGNISINKDALPLDQQGVDDLLAHELTHTRQTKRGMLQNLINTIMGNVSLPYNQRPIEQEAFETERRRANLRHDIPLVPEK